MTGCLSAFGSRLSGALQPGHDTEIGITAGACTLFMAVVAVPFTKYVFLLFFALLSIVILRTMIQNGEGKSTLVMYVRLFWPLLLVALTFAIALARTTTVPSGLAKEALAVVIVLFFGLLFLRVLRTADDIARFQDILTRQMVYLAALVIALCMLKFMLVLNDIPFGPLMTAPDGRYPLGSSLLKDYNYFSLALLLAFTAVISLLRRYPGTGRSQWSGLQGNLQLYSLCMLIALVSLVFFSSPNSAIWNTLMRGAGQNNPLVRYDSMLTRDSEGQFGLIDTRASRFILAWKIYTVEYGVTQALFGAGFNYLGRYADVYRERNEYWLKNVRIDYDYPHNPLLAALLSGGLSGISSLLCYLAVTAWSYFRTWSTTLFFAIWQGILLLFGFFSGNTIFSTPWFIVIACLPSIVQHIKDGEGSCQRKAIPAGTA